MLDRISREVGYRLAALADGEGSFGIYPRSAGDQPTYRCSFVVKMRADDRPFLERMRDELGLGLIRWTAASVLDGARRQPNVRWVIEKKHECRDLTEIFDVFGLWSKKAADYAIWREAAIYWANCGGGDIDWSPMQAWREELAQARTYQLEEVLNGC